MEPATATPQTNRAATILMPVSKVEQPLGTRLSRVAAAVIENRILQRHRQKKCFAAQWSELAESRGTKLEVATVQSELSNLLAGKRRGFTFFLVGTRTAITARALGMTVPALRELINKPTGTEANVCALDGGAP